MEVATTWSSLFEVFRKNLLLTSHKLFILFSTADARVSFTVASIVKDQLFIVVGCGIASRASFVD